MILFLVDPCAYTESQRRITQGYTMHPNRGDLPFDHDFPKISYINVNRIQQEQLSADLRKGFYTVKDCRHIHQQRGKYPIQILDIPKEHVKRREYQPHAQIKHHQTQNWE